MNPQANDLDQAYLEQYWDMIAAIAWKEFKVHGRGAVLVENAGQPKEQSIYLPLKMLAGNPLGHEYAALVREYDPRREVVVIFMRPPCSVSVYNGAMSGRETPPQAYARLNKQLFSDHRDGIA